MLKCTGRGAAGDVRRRGCSTVDAPLVCRTSWFWGAQLLGVGSNSFFWVEVKVKLALGGSW